MGLPCPLSQSSSSEENAVAAIELNESVEGARLDQRTPREPASSTQASLVDLVLFPHRQPRPEKEGLTLR